MGINEMKEPQSEPKKVLSIVLHEGIGLLKIGMRPEQILASIVPAFMIPTMSSLVTHMNLMI